MCSFSCECVWFRTVAYPVQLPVTPQKKSACISAAAADFFLPCQGRPGQTVGKVWRTTASTHPGHLCSQVSTAALWSMDSTVK